MQNTDIAKEAVVVLREAERRLRELLGRAAADGDYDAAERVTTWSRTVAALALDAETAPPAGAAPRTAGILSARGAGTLPARLHGHTGATGVSDLGTPGLPEQGSIAGRNGNGRARPDGLGAQARRARRAPAKGEYPKFFRRGDNLVKIAWSKKEREEYEHKAPRRTVDALASAIARRSANGKLFTVEDLLPLKYPDDGGEIPGYQLYVALAWFKAAGLVKQHGRRGYTVRKGPPLASSLIPLWQQLDETAT